LKGFGAMAGEGKSVDGKGDSHIKSMLTGLYVNTPEQSTQASQVKYDSQTEGRPQKWRIDW